MKGKYFQESASDMPAYFKFLTVLAYKVFLEEKVQVAIVEVGIGAESDCTNVIRWGEGGSTTAPTSLGGFRNVINNVIKPH